jgi:diguanylate cyclase (GGDEF)-like protein
MYKRLDALIEEGQRNASRFGLIYIDLDKFKPINDTYGHHIGDVYLQQVSTRMAHQLLGGDMLARLGGDEFAALVSLQHGQADLDRVVARLESCFDAPFNLEGTLLQGEASFGPSIYPKDGTTKESLLAAADAAMYAAKNRKKQMSQDAAVAQQVPRGTEKPS